MQTETSLRKIILLTETEVWMQKLSFTQKHERDELYGFEIMSKISHLTMVQMTELKLVMCLTTSATPPSVNKFHARNSELL